MANILIAAGPEGTARLQEVLAPLHRLTLARAVADAVESAETCDLFVCGLEFDESRMFDFLQEVNTHQHLKDKPRVCMRFFATNTPENVIDGLDVAARAVGAAGLVDIPALDAQFGRQRANVEILKLIETALNGSNSLS